MNTTQKIIAKSVLLKYMYSTDWKHTEDNIISLIDNFETLDAFVEYLVLRKNAPLYCLPSNYIQNKEFLLNLINRKQCLINEIYELNYSAYRKILNELDLKKFLKRCKFALLPQIKRDISILVNANAMQDEVATVIPTEIEAVPVPVRIK